MPGDTIRAEPASLLRRLISWFIDAVVVSAATAALLSLAAVAIGHRSLSEALVSISGPGVLLGLLLGFIYTALGALLFDGRTLGRLVAGIHLVDSSGLPPSPPKALLRACFSVLSLGFFLAGFWMALFDRHGQTLHDKLTRTFVVRF
jgi:resuscitation-promoting factor RpfA